MNLDVLCDPFQASFTNKTVEDVKKSKRKTYSNDSVRSNTYGSSDSLYLQKYG